MEQRRYQNNRKPIRKNHKQVVAISLVVTALLSLSLATGLALKDNGNEQKQTIRDDKEFSSTTQSPAESIEKDKLENGYYSIGEPKYNGAYYQYGEEDLIKMARNSLKRVGKMFQTVDGIGPMGEDGEFFPDYFNEYFLASVAFNESSGRTVDKNGKPITSSAGAIGLMQIKPEAINYANYYAGQFMGIEGVNYTVEDLKDGEKSMDIATILLIANCKNFAQSWDEIFKVLDEPFSAKRQEEIILAYYNNGEGNMNKYMANGTVTEYLREGNPTNYANKIISKRQELQKKYTSLEDFYNFEIER